MTCTICCRTMNAEVISIHVSTHGTLPGSDSSNDDMTPERAGAISSFRGTLQINPESFVVIKPSSYPPFSMSDLRVARRLFLFLATNVKARGTSAIKDLDCWAAVV